MNKTTNILRGRPWLMLLALFAWLLPQRAAAEEYVHDPSHYSVSLGGTNIVYFTAPVYDQKNVDQWINEGRLYCQPEGESRFEVIYWESSKNIDSDATEVSTKFSTTVGGFFDITKGNTTSTFRLTKNNPSWIYIKRNSDGYSFTYEAEWVVPYNLLGKKLTFTWEVERWGNGSWTKTKVTGLKTVTINMPAASAKLTPFVSTPMMDPNSPGKLQLPWFLASDSITKAYYEYTDAAGKYHKEDLADMNSGIIMLDANVPHKGLRLVCNYKEQGDKGSYEIEGVGSSPQNVPMIHGPVGLTARPLSDRKPKVELLWNVPYPDAEDLTPTDFFEIQRSLTGKEEDFRTISSSTFYAWADKKTQYTYVDSTLLEAIQTSMLAGGGTLDHLTYRVRRAITQNWGWGVSNNCATTASCALDNLHLLRIADYSAQWEDEDAHTVRVSWQYADEKGAVWDDRAKMVLRVISKNRRGAIVDSLIYTIDDETERAQRYKVVNLTHSCVYYDIDMYVERGTSPINQLEDVTEGFFPIRNADDWKEFKNKVQVSEGKYDVNARLYADIATDQLISWESRYAYRGVFDGNGHTITFNLADTRQEFMAPFRYVGNATIKNLRTAGTINTSARYAAGLIGCTMEGATVNIENCRSSVTLNSSVNGEGLLAGFIACQSGSNVVIRNCKFDGRFEGDHATHDRGFVAWVARGSSLAIDNCVFAPDCIATPLEGCQTWVGLDTQNVQYSNINNYATREYSAYIVIRNATDWHQFAVMVNESTNRYWVDAVLDADITISEPVGVTEGARYRGTFNGNGHTITFNKSGVTEKYMAPFRHVGDATIKNLHTVGTISSSNMYTTGLVAQVVNGGNLTIENCHSSMTINNSGSKDMTSAGFVGRVSSSTVTIRNSKFDGSFEGANSYGHGGFVSWVDENSSATIENCLFDPANISTKYDRCETWACKDAKGSVTVTNSHATRYFGTETAIIDGKTFMVLRSTTDWMNFKEALKTNDYTNAIMADDFTVTDCVAWDGEGNFHGIFDGNGHTLNMNINEAGANISPFGLFKYAHGCTIKNLHVTGKIKGGDHVAGLVGSAGEVNGKWTDIFNCRVSASIESSGWMAGGFIGRGTNANIQNSLFDGSVWCQRAQVDNSQNWAGAFHGFRDGAEGTVFNAIVQNCLEKATWYNILRQHLNSKPWTYWGNGENADSKNNWSYTGVSGASKVTGESVGTMANYLGNSNWEVVGGNVVPKMFKTTIPANPWSTMSASEMVTTLGDNWTVSGGKAIPIMPTLTIATVANEESFLSDLGNGWTVENGVLFPYIKSIDPTYATINDPNLKGLFYYKNTGKIEPELLTQTRQSSVLLSWSTDRNPIDYFRVLRRMKGQGEDQWTEVAWGLTDLNYEDTSVSPLLTYEYKVQAVNDCEGRDSTETKVVVGECKHTGRVEGYVRFNDGTGAPGIWVAISYDGNEVTRVKTDESGYFEQDELSYQGKTTADYSVGPVADSGINIPPVQVTFDATSNNKTLREFTIENGRRFSGYVMYDGTSIPVTGVNFLVDGNSNHNAQGEFEETDYDGSFSFRLLEGDHTIQAVMADHVFTNDGWYKNSNKQNITADIAGIYFYDATKVTLTGRIVGGDDQGQKPLMNNLSTNNLGDSLTMVLTLEGDNTSWLVYDNQHPNRSEREEVVHHPNKGQNHYTTVRTERKRMTVWPDVTTGEYTLKLPPVRWKVQQVYCSGYPTLFQEEQVSEVIDLTNALDTLKVAYDGIYYDVDEERVENPTATYQAVYNRIYHSPVEVTYKQVGYDNFDYFGDKTYASSELTGETVEVPLVYSVRKPNWPANRKDSLMAVYTLGYPVFSIERKYNIQLQVAERYLYNNNPLGRVDMVPLKGRYGLHAERHEGTVEGRPEHHQRATETGQPGAVCLHTESRPDLKHEQLSAHGDLHRGA